jgi:hypothetical protein
VTDARRNRMASETLIQCDINRVRLRSCASESADSIAEITPPFSLEFTEPKWKALGIRRDHLIIEVGVLIQSFDSSADKKLVFRFNCTFQLEYQLRNGFVPTEEQMSAFAKKYGVFNSWPYVREMFQSLMQRMGLNPPVLPLLRVAPFNLSSDNQSTKKRKRGRSAR